MSRLLDARAAEMPLRDALIDARHRLTYGEVHGLVRAVAAGLRAEGILPGDRVAVSLPNSVHAVILYLACMRVGAMFVGIHPGLAPVEKVRLVETAQVGILFATPGITASLAAGPDPVSGLHVPVELSDLRLEGVVRPAPDDDWADPDPTAPAAIAFTSGTTGRPKGVVHDQQHMLLPPSVILHDRMGGRGERVGVHLPLTTLNVLVLGPVLAMLGGGTCICIDGHGPELLADVVRAERIEHMSTSPAIVSDLLAHRAVDPRSFAGVRLGVGGIACPESLRDAYRSAVGRDFTTGYGLTEAPTSVTQETERVAHRAGASGVAMAHVQIEIVDDDGRPSPIGEDGEITVRAAGQGPWAGRFRGLHSYLDAPDDTARARRGGRLHTGDVGMLDGDGYLHVRDRQSDMINRGGSKVSPIEVETVLRGNPAVADCIVMGLADERLGHTVAAAVVLRPESGSTTADLRRECARELAGYKVPSTIMIVDALPRNPMGKVIRAEVMAQLTTAVEKGDR